MAPFYGWDSTTPRLEPLRGEKILTKLHITHSPHQYYSSLYRYSQLNITKQNNVKNVVPIWHSQWMEALTKSAKITCCNSYN